MTEFSKIKTADAKLTSLKLSDSDISPEFRNALEQIIEERDTLRDSVISLKKRVEILSALADRDPHLNTLNRRAFVRELERLIVMASRYNIIASLVFLDIDGLKKINDQFGHHAGDQVLKHTTEYVLRNIRACDQIGRLGGDEFAILFPHTSLSATNKKSEELSAGVARLPLAIGDVEISVRLSFGAIPLSSEHTAETALAAADLAMYKYKKEFNQNTTR